MIILLLFRFCFSFYLKFIFSMQRLTLWFATLLMVFKTINICLGWLLADLPWVPVHKDLHAVAEGAGGGRAGLTGALRPLSRLHPRPSAGHHQGRSTYQCFWVTGLWFRVEPIKSGSDSDTKKTVYESDLKQLSIFFSPNI